MGGCVELRLPPRPPGMAVGGGQLPKFLTFVQTPLSVPSFHRRQLGELHAHGRGREWLGGEEAAISPTSSHPPGPVGPFSPSGPFRLLKSSHGLSLSAPFLASELRSQSQPHVTTCFRLKVQDQVLSSVDSSCGLSPGFVDGHLLPVPSPGGPSVSCVLTSSS